MQRRNSRWIDAAELKRAVGDSTVWMLVAANLGSLIYAIVQDWSLSELMLIYWVQSVVIGISYVARMLSLDNFSSIELGASKRRTISKPAAKIPTALFFCVHYGFFHFAYLNFITDDATENLFIDVGLWLCITGFAINHLFSYIRHRELDRQGKPSASDLMSIPYLRIVPMHLTIIVGSMLPDSAGIVLFGILKTIADVIMHLVEHRRLRHNPDSPETAQ